MTARAVYLENYLLNLVILITSWYYLTVLKHKILKFAVRETT